MEDLLKNNIADDETQAIRLSLLKGKSCLWITTHIIPMMSAQMKSRVDWVLEQGVELVAVFKSPEDRLYPIMKENNYFKEALFVDLDADDVSEQIVAAVAESGLKIDAVFSPYEQVQTIVGDVGQALNLQSNPGQAYTIARSKNLTRDVLREKNIPTPRSGIAKDEETLKTLLEHVGYPNILKPSSGAGSCGVFRADNFEQAKEAFDKIMEDVTKNECLNWNPGCDENVCLVEQLLVGDEFDTDILLWDSKPVYVRTVDNWKCEPPYYLETGSNLPTVFPKETISELEQYSLDCVLACGFTFGCFHVECIVTDEGPRLIEVNARQGGGAMQEFNMEIYNVDVFANFFMTHFGIPINPKSSEAKFAMADFSLTCPKTGVLRDVDFVETIRQHPNVIRCTPFVKPGDKVVGFDTAFPQWLLEYFVKANSAQECVDIVDSINSKLVLNIDPVEETPVASDEETENVKATPEQETPETLVLEDN